MGGVSLLLRSWGTAWNTIEHTEPWSGAFNGRNLRGSVSGHSHQLRTSRTVAERNKRIRMLPGPVALVDSAHADEWPQLRVGDGEVDHSDESRQSLPNGVDSSEERDHPQADGENCIAGLSRDRPDPSHLIAMQLHPAVSHPFATLSA